MVTDTDTGKSERYYWTAKGDAYIANVPITEDGHYTVSAYIADTAGNATTFLNFAGNTTGGTIFVIDNTAPEILVTYGTEAPLNDAYFNASRTATVTVTDRNFNPGKINAEIRIVLEDGTERFLAAPEWISNGNTHTAIIPCEEEGAYTVTVTGTDALGNAAPITTYAGAASRNFVIDTHIDAAVLTDVEEGTAYAGLLVPAFTAMDKNFDAVTVSLKRTDREHLAEDVTDEMLAELTYEEIENGISTVLDIFPNEPDIDGIYTLAVTVTDKAGNSAESTVTFSVNRFGSVYVYDESLVELIGSSVVSQSQDLIIREYNPSGIVEDSVQVYITVNGSPISNPIYSVEVNDSEGNGWCEHIYTISAENFTADGEYEVVISTEDLAGNIPENTSEDSAIRFSVDTTAPELTSIVGLEKEIFEADSIAVRLFALDNVKLSSIVVYLNGAEHTRWDDINAYSFEDQVIIPAGYEQHIRIVVTDAAGNILDTEDEAFAPGYEFNDTVTISTNMFLRFYANKPLFFGVIAVVVALIFFILFFLFKRKKKERVQF